MSDHEELVEGEARPDASQDDGRKSTQAPLSAQHLRTASKARAAMGVDGSARRTLEDDELRVMRASPYNLRWS